MNHVFLFLLSLAICLSSLSAFTIDQNAKSSALNMGKKYEDNNEFVLDEREARETFPNENSDFHDGGKTDDDLFFALEDDTKWKNKKSMDYSEWERSNGLKLNDDDKVEEEVEEEKGVIKKLIKKFKNLLHKLGKRR